MKIRRSLTVRNNVDRASHPLIYDRRYILVKSNSLTPYDLCKIDLPNGGTDAVATTVSLVTLCALSRRPMGVINIRTEWLRLMMRLA